MSAESFQRVRELFEEISSMPRKRWAKELRAREIDDSIRQQVESLLAEEQRHRDGGAGTDGLQIAEATRLRGVVRAITLPKGTRIGPYAILQLIGEGPRAAVYMASKQGSGHRWVALKLIDVRADADAALTRFDTVRCALSTLDQPNIAGLLDSGSTEDGRPYFVTELVQGNPITEHCDKHTLQIRQRLELFLPVCRALQDAHDNAVIHGDLQPANILVTARDGEPVPRVLDFGMPAGTDRAQLSDSESAAGGPTVEWPPYMSPEQALPGNDEVDNRADIYALGAVLCELLTGAAPKRIMTRSNAGTTNDGHSLNEVRCTPPSEQVGALGDELRSIAERRAVKPRHLARRLRGDLDDIVLKCLEYDRACRYADARTLVRDIENHLNTR